MVQNRGTDDLSNAVTQLTVSDSMGQNTFLNPDAPEFVPRNEQPPAPNQDAIVMYDVITNEESAESEGEER